MNGIEDLAESFSRLPGIGKKSAMRIAYYLLKTDQSYLDRFATQVQTIQQRIKRCSICGSYTEKDPCEICSDSLRDKSLICVVEQPQDIQVIESFHEFRGLYHVLGGLIAPLDGIGPEKLSIDKLIERIKEGKVKEIIIATNPTVEGDTTALYLQNIIKQMDIKVSRLATGIPVGGDLEYADKLTLSRSFRGRIEY